MGSTPHLPAHSHEGLLSLSARWRAAGSGYGLGSRRSPGTARTHRAGQGPGRRCAEVRAGRAPAGAVGGLPAMARGAGPLRPAQVSAQPPPSTATGTASRGSWGQRCPEPGERPRLRGAPRRPPASSDSQRCPKSGNKKLNLNQRKSGRLAGKRSALTPAMLLQLGFTDQTHFDENSMFCFNPNSQQPGERARSTQRRSVPQGRAAGSEH